jgi:hypothetical protein
MSYIELGRELGISAVGKTMKCGEVVLKGELKMLNSLEILSKFKEIDFKKILFDYLLKFKSYSKFKQVLLVSISTFIVLFCFKSVLMKPVIVVSAKVILGTDVKMDSFSFGVFTRSVKIKGFKIYDPEGFPKDVLVNIPQIKVSFNLLPLLKGKIHLREVIFNLKELSIVENIDRKLNVDSLAVVKKESKEAESKEVETKVVKEEKSETELNFQIDVLKLKVGKVVKKTYKKDSKYPHIKVSNINFNQEYKNIKSPSKLVILILAETMKRGAIKSAMVYGAASVLSTTFLPAGIVVNLLKGTSVSEEFDRSSRKVFNAVLKYVKQRGELIEKNKAEGLVSAKINNYDVYFTIVRMENKNIKLTVSAKKMFLPKVEIANAMLYEIGKILE